MERSTGAYCTLCLGTSVAASVGARLVPSDAHTFLALFQVRQATPWLCVCCSHRIRSFLRLKEKAHLTNQWLQNAQCGHISDNNFTKIKRGCLEVTSLTSINIFYGDITNLEEKICNVVKSEPRTPMNDNEQRCNEPFGYANVPLPDALIEPHMPLPKVEPTFDPLKVEIENSGSDLPILEQKNTDDCEIILVDELYDMGKLILDMVGHGIKMVIINEEEYQADIKTLSSSMEFQASMYRCDKCVISFTTQSLLEDHLMCHSPTIGPHCCHLCGSYHTDANSLSVHVETSHLQRYECSMCGHRERCRQETVKHYFAKHTNIIHRCKVCLEDIADCYSVTEHLNEKCVRRKKQKTQQKCKYCSKMITTGNLSRHILSHQNFNKVKCHICNKELKHLNSLRLHVYKNHSSNTYYKAKVECSICKKLVLFVNKRLHEQTHNQEEFLCQLCGKVYKGAQSLQMHKKRVHGRHDYKYECNDCGHRFFSKTELQSHIDSKHMKRKGSYECELCDAAYHKNNALQRHIKSIHQKMPRPKDKLCDLCGRGFSTVKVMENHRLIHTGEKPHECNTCGQKFRQKAALEMHYKLKHLNIKWTDLQEKRKQRRANRYRVKQRV